MVTGRLLDPVDICTIYQEILDRIEVAAGRSGRRGKNVLLVAVTKTATPDQIRQLTELGHVDFGESRVQQLQQRVATIDEFLMRRKTLAGAAPKNALDIPDKVRWHMIGHLQRNKVKQVVPLIDLIHSIDSLRLAEELDVLGGKLNRTIDILLQVNTSGEQSKFGVVAPAAVHLAEQISSMMNIRLRGVMTMAPHHDNPEASRGTFARCAEIFDDLKNKKIGECNILSMGMSNDYEVAIEEGSNLVRVGRSIFGDAPSDE